MNLWIKIKDIIGKLPISVRIISIYNLITIVVASIFYPLIPSLLNYPPDTVNTHFEVELDDITYTWQYIVIILIIIAISSFFLRKTMKKIDEWGNYSSGSIEDINKIKNIRKKCLNVPYIIYLVQVIFPTLAVLFVLLAIVKASVGLVMAITILVFSFGTLAAIISLIFSKRILTKVLVSTFSSNNKEGLRFKLRSKIFLQLIPIILVAILFTSLLGYSRQIKEKGDLIFQNYKMQLELRKGQVNVNSISTAQELLKRIKLLSSRDITFVITPNNDIITSDGSLPSKVFIKYLNERTLQKNDGRVYTVTGEVQGVITKLNEVSGPWIIGVEYQVDTDNTLVFFIVSSIILLLLNLFVLSYFSKSLSDDISLVVKNLSEIADGEDVENIKPLPVTSNDEIGDLVIAFNKIQELERKQIEEIRLTQQQLVERERLASLGELAGGVAHDINSPLSSVQTGFYMINRLSQKYNSEKITIEELKEILKQIEEHSKNGTDTCQKIAKIVNSVRNHTRNLSGENVQDFYVTDIIEDLKVLLAYQLKQSGCELVLIEEDKILIKGDSGKLGQVLTNLIVNAIQAYNGKPGKIETRVEKKDNKLLISIADTAGGIPQSFREGIFKNILTTKGTEGTGLGLYLSYSIITGHFGGDMWFESEEGQGTVFYISIPIEQK